MLSPVKRERVDAKYRPPLSATVRTLAHLQKADQPLSISMCSVLWCGYCGENYRILYCNTYLPHLPLSFRSLSLERTKKKNSVHFLIKGLKGTENRGLRHLVCCTTRKRANPITQAAKEVCHFGAFKATTKNFHFVLILVAPVGKSSRADCISHEHHRLMS